MKSGSVPTGYSQANGQDIVYSIYLNAGDMLAVTLTDENYDAAIYMLTDRSDMNSRVAGGDDPEQFGFTADATGTYHLVTDGHCCDYCGTATVTIGAPVATTDQTWGACTALNR